jgi:hypothetical protein
MDNQYQSLAAVALTERSNAADKPRAPLMAEYGERASHIAKALAEVDETLSTLRTRMFGPLPPRGQLIGAAQQVAHSEGQAADFAGQLQAILEAATTIREHASVLNSRI